MRKYAENNKISLCHALRHEGVYSKKFAGGYLYLNDGEVCRSSASVPIYLYAKNYEKFGASFALFVWSTDADASQIALSLDAALEGLTKKEISTLEIN